MPDIFDSYTHQRPSANPIIYVYRENYMPNLLKIGYTTKPVDDRMEEIHPLKSPVKTWEVLYTTPALYDDGTAFMDHDVHKELVRRGFQRQKDYKNASDTEFFKCNLNDVEAAIHAVKTHTLNEENRTQTFKMRPEQAAAVNQTVRYYWKAKNEDPGHAPKFLWNCKMRFGKTFASYELMKKMGLKKCLILTFKPAVEDAWESDLLSHVDFEGWQFYSAKYGKEHNISPEQLDQHKPIVCFGSFQDYLGTDADGNIKIKNQWVHAMNWDIIIFDEYHFGAWRDTAQKLFAKDNEDAYDSLDIEKYAAEEANNAWNESFLPITSDYYLYLSGTPFRAINTGEFLEDQIFSWTYSDEQAAKAKWNSKDGPNPYEELPRMVMMTYKMPDELERVAKNSDTDEFDLNVFFSAKSDTGRVEDSQFVYGNEVQKWLNMIRGSYMPMSMDDLKRNNGERPVMPFSDRRMLNILTHTLWFLPNVASCFAMKNLLDEKQNTFWHDYTVNVCAGSQAGIGLAAVTPVRQSMTPALETKTITLSCGKLTTGVTIKPWTGILMLRNLSSPETYFQAAFRVQSPWTVSSPDGTKTILKRDCYVFDFAVNRCLRQISDYSRQLNINEPDDEKKVGDFIRFLPVLAFDGSVMAPVDAGQILDIVTAGTSASLLARRWESALLVNVTNEVLQKILNNQAAYDALMKIEGFRALNVDIATIINRSDSIKKAHREGGENLSEKEKKKLSDEEKEIKSQRKQIQEKLIKFATRIPIFMYLTEYREHSLKDVITKLEPELFKRTTGLTVEDFELLLSIGVFNESLMNDAIVQFRRYEAASLEYTGIARHDPNENVGLFSTVISREDFDELAKEQHISMTPSQSIYKAAVETDQYKQDKRKTTARANKDINRAPISTAINLKHQKFEPQHVKPVDSAQTSRTSVTVDKPGKFNKYAVRVGSQVVHKMFGSGTVTQMDKEHVFVQFEKGEKRFMFPDAFEMGFLTLK